MEKPGLADWALAPLTWLERTKGWKRRGLLLLYAVIASMVGVLGWRGLSLWRLPDIGEPFDVAKYGTVDVPDAANAMILYSEAAKKLTATELTDYKKVWGDHDWGTADPEVRQWVVDNRPALAIWLEGTERPDSLLVQPRDLTRRTIPVFELRKFARLAELEASRLEADGDLGGAWRLHRANLRSSRHAGMHGGPMQRYIGYGILTKLRPEVQKWIDDPRVKPEMLRKAIADVETCKRMTAPASEMIRAGYFVNRSFLNDPGNWVSHHDIYGPDGMGAWYNHFSFVPATRHFLMREPERSLRVLRLLTAGQLAQCDRPSAVRPKLFSRDYQIYEVDPRTPRSVAALRPEELEAWAERSELRFISRGSIWLTQIDYESGAFDSLLLRMAERAFEIEHGRPPKTYGELLGPYLKALPEGIEAVNLVSASQGPN